MEERAVKLWICKPGYGVDTELLWEIKSFCRQNVVVTVTEDYHYQDRTHRQKMGVGGVRQTITP